MPTLGATRRLCLFEDSDNYLGKKKKLVFKGLQRKKTQLDPSLSFCLYSLILSHTYNKVTELQNSQGGLRTLRNSSEEYTEARKSEDSNGEGERFSQMSVMASTTTPALG